MDPKTSGPDPRKDEKRSRQTAGDGIGRLACAGFCYPGGDDPASEPHESFFTIDAAEAVRRDKEVVQALASVLDRLDIAVVVVDPTLRVVFANHAADALVRRNDGIAVRRKRLTLSLACEVALLDAIACLAAPDGTAGPVRRVVIRRQDGLPRYLLRVHPTVGHRDLPDDGNVAATIVVERLGRNADLPDADDLRAVFDLTAREAAVARLVPSGGARREIGASLGVSVNTVKTHLAAVLEKTGARNTRELVRLLASFPRR